MGVMHQYNWWPYYVGLRGIVKSQIGRAHSARRLPPSCDQMFDMGRAPVLLCSSGSATRNTLSGYARERYDHSTAHTQRQSIDHP
jgi:hypothetical protein